MKIDSVSAFANGIQRSPGTPTSVASFSEALAAQLVDAQAVRKQQESTLAQGRTAIQEKLLNSAASDPQGAEKIVHDMAYTPSTILYDLRGVGGGDAVNKLSSGRIIDEAFKANFASEASAIDAQRKLIYDAEKAKGTPSDQILAKLFDFTNSQSWDYLEAGGWLASAGGKTV